MAHKSLFISRALAYGSPFQGLRDHLHIIDESLIEFSPVHFHDFPETEWIFFYSQRSVQYFLDQLSGTLPAKVRLAAFGPKTAGELTARGLTPAFIGTGRAEDTTPAFIMLCQSEKVLFPRARTSMRSVQKLLPEMVQSFDLVVYDNTSRTDFTLPACDMLIFTSPLNAKTYFGKYKKAEGQVIFAIGSTTAAMVEKLTGEPALIPENPSETELAKLVEQYI